MTLILNTPKNPVTERNKQRLLQCCHWRNLWRCRCHSEAIYTIMKAGQKQVFFLHILWNQNSFENFTTCYTLHHLPLYLYTNPEFTLIQIHQTTALNQCLPTMGLQFSFFIYNSCKT